MTQTAHEWMLDIVATAEDMGYLVRYVGVDEIGLTRPELRSYTDITIKGRFVNGRLLRDTLVPVQQGDPKVDPHA